MSVPSSEHSTASPAASTYLSLFLPPLPRNTPISPPNPHTIILGNSTGASPVGKLPDEILTQLFLIVSQENYWNSDRLAQVCSRWRSVALNYPYLWSHIDYSPHEFNTPGSRFYSRNLAELHVARSAGVPLEIHITESYDHDEEDLDLNLETKQFFESIVPRMGALYVKLQGTDFDEVIDFYQAVIIFLISNSTPGCLTKLVIDYTQWANFVPAGAKNDIYGLELPLSASELDQIFTPITVLDVKGLYPQWSSTAYHGLVDLRISSDNYDHRPMSELEFVTILKASPELRILHFSYPISDRLQGDVSSFRVALNNLQVLHVAIHEPEVKLHDVLRLITPGPKPLSLAVRRRYNQEEDRVFDLQVSETEAFLSRARVEKLFISECSLSEKLLQVPPHLKILILNKYKHSAVPLPSNDQYSIGPSISPSTIEYCYLVECSLELDRFYPMVRHYSIRNIVLCRCDFFLNGEKVDEEEVYQELSRICPVVEFTLNKPRLRAHRELLHPFEHEFYD